MPSSLLAAVLQEELNSLAAAHSTPGRPLALGLGWASEHTSFGLAAGTVGATNNSAARPATPSDTFLFGSGTKPFIASAILRMAEERTLSLDDAVATHVDRVLHAANGTSLVELFGPRAARITVRHLITMQSGLADFDTPELDAAILTDATASWPPYALLRLEHT
eukprot:scaffold248255_cov27-Tisochrysis_lutea.AAC.3